MATSVSQDKWSWQNLSAELQSTDVAAAFFHSNAPSEFYQDCYYTAAGLILLFCLTRAACSYSNAANFNKLSESAKLIYVTHWAFFLIFMTTTIPYSIAMIKVLFSPDNVLDLVKPSTFRSITFPVAFQLCMYVYEGAFRAVLRINYFLVVHHIIFCTLFLLAFQSHSLFMIKVDIIVSCFATYEFLLYAALISRKTLSMQKWFKPLMVMGLSFYGFTRLIQVMLLLALFILGFGPTSHTSSGSALWWVGLGMSCALMVLQLYTFVIYKAIWVSTTQALPITQHKTVSLGGTASARWGRLSEAAPRILSDRSLNRSVTAGPRLGEVHTAL